MKSRKYRIFDIVLECNIPLPGLPECDDQPADTVVEVMSGGVPPKAGFEWIHDWKSPGGQVVTRCFRRGEEYLISFPGLCDFLLLTSENRVEAYPSPDSGDNTIAHLVMDQLIPRILGHQGRVVTHASAVVTPDKRGVVFLGNSGRGKSTLASSFYQSGFGLLTDDCLQMDLRGSTVRGLSAYPSLRLWPASAERLFPNHSELHTVAHYTEKKQLLLNESDRVITEAVPIVAAFILEEAVPGAPEKSVSIEPVKGVAAAMAMVEAAFLLDLKRRSAQKRFFLGATSIAQSGLQFFRLSYHRRYEDLAVVRARIMEFVGV